VALGVITAMMAFVVPKVVDQFDSMNQTLPLLTRLVIGVSHLMRDLGWLLALLIIGGGLIGAVLLRNPAIRLRADTALLRLPLIGRLTRDLHGAKMARTLSTMIAAGLPVLEGLTITARTVSNRRLRLATEAMADAVREGGGLSAAMRRADVFPPILVYMTASGESSGRLEPMLERAADYLEREFSTFTAVMLSLLEPAIIVVMGGVVALIVLSILLPILQINTLAMG
jgi:general secretion pathway protein F